MQIRRAATDDCNQISSLAETIWWAHYPAIISHEQIRYMLDQFYNEDALKQQMAQGQDFWLISNDNGTDIGYLALTRQAEGEYFLNKFYIDTNQHSKGLGTTAFALLLAQYPDLGTLRLRVNIKNYKSINFYFKIGFVIEFCIVTPIGQDYVMDDYQMICRVRK